MALINQSDIDIINGVFSERNKLDSLNSVNEKIISELELGIQLQDSIILHQDLVVKHNEDRITQLELRNKQTEETYSKELKKEKNKKISFQATTGAAIIAIILILLL